ncbi:MAG: hypothetical protein LBF22_12460 [Deltaproteobacteria bacterium]|jgi:hypothetical protein|nr:hypothetical protein [Deltaproteobacteria bacterium]
MEDLAIIKNLWENSIKKQVSQHSINNQLRYAGWNILISNEIENPQEAYDIYYNRDIVEIGFLKYKNVMNLDILEMHSDLHATNKLFIIFLCLIIERYVTTFLKIEKNLRYYNLDRLLRNMESILSSYNSKGELIVGPVTKQQNKIFKLFNIDPPKIICEWDKYKF